MYTKCAECRHLGTYSPKKGGWFHGRDGQSKRIAQAHLPYCGKLNLGTNEGSYQDCNYYEKYEPPVTKPVDIQPASG